MTWGNSPGVAKQSGLRKIIEQLQIWAAKPVEQLLFAFANAGHTVPVPQERPATTIPRQGASAACCAPLLLVSRITPPRPAAMATINRVFQRSRLKMKTSKIVVQMGMTATKTDVMPDGTLFSA